MKKIRTNLYYGSRLHISKQLAGIVEGHLGFEASHISAGTFCRTGGKYLPRIHLKKIKSSADVGHLFLSDDEQHRCANAFQFISIADWFLTQVEWLVNSPNIPRDDTLMLLTALPDFKVGYRSDDEDTYWQSADTVHTYEFHKRPHQHLRLIRHPYWNEERIDISGNPGRSTFFPGMKLQAAWQMWFGPGFFEYVPKERLLAFQEAEKVQLLTNERVFIQLYGRPEDSATLEARKRETAFRRWVGMDELERQSFDVRDQKPLDPGVEIGKGSGMTKGMFAAACSEQ